MKTFLLGSAAALPVLLCSVSALAQDADAAILAIGLRPDAHGPAGTMGDHVHRSGDVMIGMMAMHEEFGGSNRRGTASLTPAQIAAAGFSARESAMTMDMAMLHLMWAPSDRVTLMVVPSWMRMEMTMEGLPGAAASTGHGGHSLAAGATMTHHVEGMGDTQMGALVSLSRKPALSVHAGLMVSAPTGNASRKNDDGSYVHYMMQGGSGTWDLNPSLTVHGSSEHLGWGSQISYLFRAEDANKSGFRFGDRFAATAWLSRPVSPRLSLSARVNYTREGRIRGHYNGAHAHSAPSDRQANYGGKRIEAGLGANLIVGQRLRIGAEAALPVYQHVNGIQLPKQFGANINAAIMF